MRDEHALKMRQIDHVRGDLYTIADELEILKAQIARLPTRAFVSRLALMATGTLWALAVAVALLVT
ncbi:MAG: hypothetical protein ACJ8AH_09905 [Stellaceae bacterium]